MQHHGPIRTSALVQRAASALLALTTVFLLTNVASPGAQAQFQVVHNFTGGEDGANPYAGLTIDRGGNLYGTSCTGANGYGAVYRMKHSVSGWTFDPLYLFSGGADGGCPEQRVIFGPDGALYGATPYRGNPQNCLAPLGCGVVFRLQPPPTFCRAVSCPWTETVLHQFMGGADGAVPTGDLYLDQAGSIYGTTDLGGAHGGGPCDPNGCGTVFGIRHGDWNHSVLYNFLSGNDGNSPAGGVVLDSANNIYGTTWRGGLSNYGTVFELTYVQGFGWTESFLNSFRGGSDGAYLEAGLILDRSGNLYGATDDGGDGSGGTIFEFSPSIGILSYSLLYSFRGSATCPAATYQGPGPVRALSVDTQGNLYGTTCADGANGYGNVFKLTPSNGAWIYTDLYDFMGGNDGAYPISNVAIDATGNLYGTAWGGGSQGVGVVWEITP